MNIIVHLMFAMTLRRQIKRTMGIRLNLPGFLYGNILPDISKKYRAHPHKMKEALLHIIDSKDNLIDQHNNKYYSGYRFAKELGAINHYLSDFFCLPHTEKYHKGKIYHQYYEFIMIAHYKKGLRAYRKMLNNNDKVLKPAELKNFIVDYNKEYEDKKVSDVNDIRYALFAGIKLIECILAHTAQACPFSGKKVNIGAINA